jgi:hypothetical protein
VNVRIPVNEPLKNRAIVCLPNENGSISRLGKGTREDQISTVVGSRASQDVRPGTRRVELRSRQSVRTPAGSVYSSR